MNIEAEIIADKELLRDTDAIIQRVKALPPSRERSLTITKLQEGVMWLGMDLKRINETTGESNAVSVESTALFALLESRHETMLQWCEPWPACGPEGNDLDAHIILRATVHDCINMQRRVVKAAGRPTMGYDVNHLLDFMATHWTRTVEANASDQATASLKRR